MSETEKVPPGWGKDKLSEFFDDVRANQFATFFRKADAFGVLRELDDCFALISANLHETNHIVGGLFLIRSHSAFRAACGLATAGQAAESYPAIRSCLEHAGYASFVHGDNALIELWLRRHDDDKSRKAVIQTFKHGAIVESVATRDAKLGKIYEDLYDQSIDFGAHPNERAITGNLAILKGDNKTTFQQVALHGDGVALDNALVTVARAGLCSLHIFAHLFPERFMLLGIVERMQTLRVKL